MWTASPRVERAEDASLTSPPGRDRSAVTLSVIIPVYNGSTTVNPLVEELLKGNPGYELQIVPVNDGSQDDSRSVCRKLVHRHRGLVTFVDLARNSGEHNAVMAGLAHARGSYCVIMDDDFQNPPHEVYRLADAAVQGGYDLVYGAYDQKRHQWIRNVGSRMANALARRLMRLPKGLYLSSFKCLSRFAVDNILSYRGPFPYIDGLALRTTRNISVITTQHQPSGKEKSQYTPAKLLHLWGNMMVNFSILPLRLASVMGIVLFLAGAVGSILVVMEKLRTPNLPIGWPSLMVALLILSGLQLLVLAVFGEYLGQLVLTFNGTPQYTVREVVEASDEGDGE